MLRYPDFDEFNYLFGVLSRIISDRETVFTSQAFRMFCDNYGVKNVLNGVATPRANSQCESYNRTIVQAVAITTARLALSCQAGTECIKYDF